MNWGSFSLINHCMRKIALILFSLIMTSGFSKSSIEQYIELWSYCKYYNNTVPNFDWDKKFLVDVAIIEKEPSKQDSILKSFKTVSCISQDCLSSLGKGSCQTEASGNPHIKESKGIKNASFPMDKYFEDTKFEKSKALLGLAKTWSSLLLYYPFPQKKEKLRECLGEILPLFLESKSHKDYYYAIRVLVSKLADGHSVIESREFNPFKEQYLPPFWVKKVNDKIYVSFIKNEAVCNEASIKIGDELLAINGESVNELWEKSRNYFQSSNTNYENNRCSQWILFQDRKSNDLTFKQGLEIKEQKIDFYKIGELKFSPPKSKRKSLKEIVQDSIASDRFKYINLLEVSEKEFEKEMKRNMNTDYIIIDCRGYPKGYFVNSFADYFLAGKKEYARIYSPDYSLKTESRLVETCVVKNKKPKFNGKKVYLLVNHNSKSSMEHQILAFQTMEKVETIGTQSAGANGDLTCLHLPMGLKIKFSGLRVTYLDGSEVQGNGVKIDHKVQDGLNLNRNISDKLIELMK